MTATLEPSDAWFERARDVEVAALYEAEDSESEPSTAIIRIDPANDAAATALHAEALGLKRYAEIRIIQSTEDIALATDDLSLVAKLKKAIEQKRKEYVDPINAHLKAINEAFKTLVSPLDEADALTRGKILTYKREEARKAAEIAEINRLREEAARKEAALNQVKEPDPVQLLPVEAPPPARVQADTASLGTAKVWKWELVDFAKVPDQYKIIDAAKVGKVVRAGVREIAGIRIYSEETLRVTSR